MLTEPIHCSKMSGTGSDLYWTPLTENASQENYANLISEFFRVILRCYRGHCSEYTIPLTGAQSALADQLMDLLKSARAEISEVVDALHKFSFSLLVPQLEAEAEADVDWRWSCPVRCYLAVHALREDGKFVPPKPLTQVLAKLKYFSVNCALVEANRRKNTTVDGNGMIS